MCDLMFNTDNSVPHLSNSKLYLKLFYESAQWLSLAVSDSAEWWHILSNLNSVPQTVCDFVR